MNETTTFTPQELAHAEAHRPGAGVIPWCSICGQGFSGSESKCAHNTCSQGCARTAALVEAINGWKMAAMPTWATPADPAAFQGHTVKVDGKTATITTTRDAE